MIPNTNMNKAGRKMYVSEDFFRMIKASAALDGKTVVDFTRDISSIGELKKRLDEMKSEGITKKKDFKFSF